MIHHLLGVCVESSGDVLAYSMYLNMYSLEAMFMSMTVNPVKFSTHLFENGDAKQLFV